MDECSKCKYRKSCEQLNFLDVANDCDDLRKLVDDIRADAIEEFARMYEHIELIGCEDCKHLDDDIHCWRCIAEKLKEKKNDNR